MQGGACHVRAVEPFGGSCPDPRSAQSQGDPPSSQRHPVDAKTNEHKAALELLGILPLGGTVIAGDAMFCQRDICEKIVEGGGDYVLVIKDNQPSLATGIGAGLAYEAEKRRQHAAFFATARSSYAGNDAESAVTGCSAIIYG